MPFHRLLAIIGFAWLALLIAIPSLRGLQLSLFLSMLAIEVAFVISVYALATRGRVPMLLSLMQLALFALVPAQVVASLGAGHYTYDAPPGAADWATFSAAHGLRAADLLDVLEEFGIRVQHVHHKSVFAGLLVVGLHLTVDLMVLAVVLGWVRQLWGRGAGGGRFQRINMPAGKRVLRLIWWACFVGVIGFALMQGWRFVDYLLWPLDNLLRLLDVGDAMNVFGWRLHSVETSTSLAALAVLFRLLCALALARLLLFLRLTLLAGFGMTIEDCLEHLASDSKPGEMGYETSDAAEDRLARLPPREVVPRLLEAAADPRLQKGVGRVFRKMKGKLGPASSLLIEALRDERPPVRLAAVRALSYAGQTAFSALPLLRQLLLDPETAAEVCVTLDQTCSDWAVGEDAERMMLTLFDGLHAAGREHRDVLFSVFQRVSWCWHERPEAAAVIQKFFADLESPDAGTRESAAAALAHCYDAARPAAKLLLRGLAHGTIPPAVAASALDAAMPDWRSTPSLTKLRGRVWSAAIANPDALVTSWEAAVLDAIDPEWINDVDPTPWLRSLAEKACHADETVQTRAIAVLKKLGKKARGAADDLARVACTAAEESRILRAATALAAIGPGAAAVTVPAMVELVGRESRSIRIGALETLAAMGSDAGPAAPAIIEMIHRRKGDQDPIVRTAMDTLREIGESASAVAPALRELFAASKDDGFRWEIEWAMMRITPGVSLTDPS